ncbi:MAG TPA: hypothetical protein VJ813_21175 [Vicinamibacterales bacterium]|nr:hypothetical protein [Vicinamibacterales bacterium]
MGFFSFLFPWGVLLQGLAIVHFIRRRPDTIWLWVIIFLGPLGALVYIGMEVVPDLGLLRQSFEGFGRRKRIAHLEAVVLDNPSAGNYEELADLYLDEGKFARARECYDKAISPRSDQPDPIYRRGIAELHLGDFKAAVRDLESVTTRDPRYDFNRAIALLAHACAGAGQADRAEALFRHATEVSTLSETYLNYAAFLAAQNRPGEAREWAQRILARKPSLPRYLQRRERPWFRKANALLKRLPKSGGTSSAVIGTALFVVGALLPSAAAAQATAPVWPKPDLFWYRKAVEGGNLWLKVDAQHGVKEPLFDHQRLAIELTIRTGLEYTPLTLPFADPAAQFVVKYDGSNAYIQEGAMAIEFVHGGQQWRCDLQIKWDWNRVPPTDYECLPRRPANPAAPVAASDSVRRVSPDRRWEAFIQAHNVAIRPSAGGAPTLLSRDGSPSAPYQAGSIVWSADSQTLSAYRVSADAWSSEGVSGNVKKHVVRGQWEVAK